MQTITTQQRAFSCTKLQPCASRRSVARSAAHLNQTVCALPQSVRQAANTGLALLAATQIVLPAPSLAFGPFGNKVQEAAKAVDRNTPDLPSPGEIQKKVKQEGNAAGGAPSLDTKGTKDQVKDAVGNAKDNVKQAGKSVLTNAAVGSATNAAVGSAKDSVKQAGKSVLTNAAVGSAKDNVKQAGKSILTNATPKKGLFDRINEEALTDNAPSQQYKGAPINTPSGR